MHVALNLIFLVPSETGGMEVAARGLAGALALVAPGVRVTALVPREAADVDLGVDRVVVPVNSRNRFEWVRAEQTLVPRFARRARCDVVHSLASTAPLRGRFARVVTIYDLNYLVVPEAHFGAGALGLRLLVPLAARRSHRVIAPSLHTRNDLVRHLRVRPEKIDVVALAPTPRGGATPARELRARLDCGERPVLLSLSAKRPHKNLVGLVEALALIVSERRPLLVLLGYPTPYEAVIRRRVAELELEADVRFLGWVPGEDAAGLLELADCLVFPSFNEGFGLPVLEAMAVGTPVACSDRSSLPEVAGGAAVLFDPTRPADIAGAVERILFEPGLAERLAAAGRERARAFTWDRTAELTLATYERALRAAASSAER